MDPLGGAETLGGAGELKHRRLEAAILETAKGKAPTVDQQINPLRRKRKAWSLIRSMMWPAQSQEPSKGELSMVSGQ